MKIEFDEPLFEEFTERALAHAVYRGADFGECTTTAERITSGDRDSWYREWTATAGRIAALAEESATSGHSVSAREAYLRASNYYRTSYAPLFGAPPDERLIAAFEKETESFQKAATLFDPPIESVEIPYQETTLPGYFYRVDDSDQPRPTLVATNGYDSTIQEMHFAHTVAAPPDSWRTASGLSLMSPVGSHTESTPVDAQLTILRPTTKPLASPGQRVPLY